MEIISKSLAFLLKLNRNEFIFNFFYFTFCKKSKLRHQVQGLIQRGFITDQPVWGLKFLFQINEKLKTLK